MFSDIQYLNREESWARFLNCGTAATWLGGSRSGGIVTQFNVRVDDPDRLDEVAAAIDTYFAPAQEPTNTSPEKAFVARAAADVIEIVGFMGWLGWGCWRPGS